MAYDQLSKNHTLITPNQQPSNADSVDLSYMDSFDLVIQPENMDSRVSISIYRSNNECITIYKSVKCEHLMRIIDLLRCLTSCLEYVR